MRSWTVIWIAKVTKNKLFFVFTIGACFFSTTVLSFAIDSITLRLYFRNRTYVEVNAKQASQLVPHLNLTVKTLMHCHGYVQSTDSKEVVELVYSFLDGFDYNIMAADYRHVTLRDYVSSVYLANAVAKVLVDSVNDMVAAGVQKDKMILYGHSLGAQIAGKIGRELPFRVPEIVVMDPAGPLFQYVEQSLSASDALCVKCIHTDMGYYGNPEACGHLDFYPNGGSREQPGCSLISLSDPANRCSHVRSVMYMMEAATNPNAFMSIKCDSWEAFKKGNCSRLDILPMGESTPCSAAGKYYLQTNAKEPFAKGLMGTVYEA